MSKKWGIMADVVKAWGRKSKKRWAGGGGQRSLKNIHASLNYLC